MKTNFSCAIARLSAVTIAFALFLASLPTRAYAVFTIAPTNQMWKKVAIVQVGPDKVPYFVGNQMGSGTSAIFRMNTNQVILLPAIQSGGSSVAYSISLDGRYAVGSSDSPNAGDEQVEATMWDLQNPSSPVALGILGPLEFSEAFGVASTAGGPVVVGGTSSSGTSGSFIWSQPSGMRYLPLASGQSIDSSASGISADGSVFVGVEDNGFGDLCAVVGTTNGAFKLNDLGYIHSDAVNIAPNALFICGSVNHQAAFWTNSGSFWTNAMPTRLSIGTNPVMSFAATASDNGFVGGTCAAGGFIYDPRTGLTTLFDDWWLANSGAAVPQHVTGIRQILLDGEELHFILSGPAYASVSLPQPLALKAPSVVDGKLQFKFQTKIGKQYDIQARDGLGIGNWQTFDTISGDGTERTYQVTNMVAPIKFFRLREY